MHLASLYQLDFSFLCLIAFCQFLNKRICYVTVACRAKNTGARNVRRAHIANRTYPTAWYCEGWPLQVVLSDGIFPVLLLRFLKLKFNHILTLLLMLRISRSDTITSPAFCCYNDVISIFPASL